MLYVICRLSSVFFFFNDTATTEIYTLSLHDALPTSVLSPSVPSPSASLRRIHVPYFQVQPRSEEHTSELQSHHDLVCRLLLEKKKQNNYHTLNLKKKQEKQKQ